MIGSKTRWIINTWEEQEQEAAEKIAAALGLSPLTARLLVQRGCHTPDEAAQFLGAEAQAMHDPFLLKGMEAAVSRIRRAVESGEKVLIYGDYDADGVSSTSVLIRSCSASWDFSMIIIFLIGRGEKVDGILTFLP